MKLSQLTDLELIHAFQEGDAKSFDILIQRHKDRLFTSILFLVKDKYLAEDMFQETFIRIIDTIRNKKYNEEGKFFSWAMRIAHNLCVDHFRKIKRTPVIVDSNNRDIFEWLTTSSDNPQQKIMRRQSHERVQIMLNTLPEEQREVIVLRHYADLSFKEIATMANCSINTALGRMRYGLINLRKMMSEKQLQL